MSFSIEPNTSSRFTLTYTMHKEVHGYLEQVHPQLRSFLHPHFFMAWQTSTNEVLFVQCTHYVPSDFSFQPRLF